MLSLNCAINARASRLLGSLAALSLIQVSFAAAQETAGSETFPPRPPANESNDSSLGTQTHRLDEVVVSSSPLSTTLFESAQPVTVLSGTELQTKAGASLGQTLSGQPGIASTGFGPGASRPIIRGLGGDRIRILENGIGTQDVSNTSPDHLVTVEPSLVEKIEVVRGPAALLYGTSAVGGVVNVFDGRIPEVMPEGPISGNVQIRGGTVDSERSGAISLNAPAGPIAFHLDGFKRRTDDIDIPGFARTKAARNNSELEYPEPKGKLPFSDTDSDNITFGASYIQDSGFLGASVSDFNSTYGVPNGEENISIDAERQRIDVHGKVFEPTDSIKSMDLKVGIVDYEHTEFEGSEQGTVFKNRGVDARYEVAHEKLGPLEGVAGFQYQFSDFEALGEEAFQPPTETNVGSGFIFEEYEISKAFKAQLGGRFDHQSIDAKDYRPADGDATFDISKSFPTFSQSAGVVWSPSEDYAVALSIAHTERAPAGQELFANGPHVATAAFEIGDPNLDPERSWGYDVTLRKKAGQITGSVGGFYNRFSNYIGALPTDEMADDLRVYRFTAVPADFYGFESQIAYHLLGEATDAEDLSIDFQPDYVYAENRDTGEPIPRIPPLRMKWGINYTQVDFISARLELQHVFRQGRNASEETETPHYTFLNAYVSKPIKVASYSIDLFVRGTNLLNEKAREHTSFIKDVAPQAGANVVAGVGVRF